MNTTCMILPSRPISFLAWAARARAVGQTAGHWVKPKNTTGIRPRYELRVTVSPSVFLSLKVRPMILSLRSLPYLKFSLGL